MNKKGAKESSSSIGSPRFLLCKLNSFSHSNRFLIEQDNQAIRKLFLFLFPRL